MLTNIFKHFRDLSHDSSLRKPGQEMDTTLENKSNDKADSNQPTDEQNNLHIRTKSHTG